jgi:hypothetical protein
MPIQLAIGLLVGGTLFVCALAVLARVLHR